MRKIIHIDMDCFFVAVEERDDPALKGKPVAVGGAIENRGVISTANYIARKYSVHSAMPTAKAKRLCPKLIILNTNMHKYKAASNNIKNIFKKYTSLIEPLSLDEAFLDVSNCVKCHGSATWIAESIRKEIFRSEKLTASAGISINKFIAKIASDWNKPNGQYVVPPQDVNDFVTKLPIEKIFGVGPKTATKLHNINIKTCEDLQNTENYILQKLFGKFGTRLSELCHGIDNRPVNPNRIRKSVSVEETFSKDLNSFEQCSLEIKKLAEKLQHRLYILDNKHDKKIHKLFVKIRFSDFQHTTIETLSSTTCNKKISQLLEEGFKRCENRNIRLLGLGVRFLELKDNLQLKLFS